MDIRNTADADVAVRELEGAVFEVILPVQNLDVNLVINTDSGSRIYKLKAIPIGFKSTHA